MGSLIKGMPPFPATSPAGDLASLGFVVMPNHVHAIISFIESPQSINTIIGNGKRFMAYEIIKRLQ
jgi:hypothetical protein